MSRFRHTSTPDLLAMLQWAPRKRTNPFAVTEALVELLGRSITPLELGGAVAGFDANLAAEARDALEQSSSPMARFIQATVPGNVDGARVEGAWRAAAWALMQISKLKLTRGNPTRASLVKLVSDEVVLEGAQVAVATSPPAHVDANRWFFPLLVFDGSSNSVDALLPHFDAALAGNRKVRSALTRLKGLATSEVLGQAFERMVEGGRS